MFTLIIKLKYRLIFASIINLEFQLMTSTMVIITYDVYYKMIALDFFFNDNKLY